MPKDQKERIIDTPFTAPSRTGASSYVPGTSAGTITEHTLNSHTGNLDWSRVDKTGSALSDIVSRPHSALTGIAADDHHDPVTVTTRLTLDTQLIDINLAAAFSWTGSHSWTQDLQVNADLDFIGAQSITTSSGDLTIAPTDDISLIPGEGEVKLTGDLKFMGDARSIQTASSYDLTIIPGGNIVLDPTGGYVEAAEGVNLKSDDYASRTTGWQITDGGNAEFRNLIADELQVKVFTAALEQVSDSIFGVFPSSGILSRDFNVPNPGNTRTLYVHDKEAMPDTRIFTSGDTVCIQEFSRSATGLTVAYCWGVVTNYSDLSDGEQSWTFTRSSSPNGGSASGTILAGVPVVDYGTAGDGIVETIATPVSGDIDEQDTPFMHVATWATHPASLTERVRVGNLTGLSLTGISGHGFYTGEGSTRYFASTPDGIYMRNANITSNDGSADTVNITSDGELKLGTNVDDDATTYFSVTSDGNVRMGPYATDQPNLMWDQAAGDFSIRVYDEDVIRFESTGDSYFTGVMQINTSGEFRFGDSSEDMSGVSLPDDFTGIRMWKDGTQYAGHLEYYANGDQKWHSVYTGAWYTGYVYGTSYFYDQGNAEHLYDVLYGPYETAQLNRWGLMVKAHEGVPYIFDYSLGSDYDDWSVNGITFWPQLNDSMAYSINAYTEKPTAMIFSVGDDTATHTVTDVNLNEDSRFSNMSSGRVGMLMVGPGERYADGDTYWGEVDPLNYNFLGDPLFTLNPTVFLGLYGTTSRIEFWGADSFRVDTDSAQFQLESSYSLSTTTGSISMFTGTHHGLVLSDTGTHTLYGANDGNTKLIPEINAADTDPVTTGYDLGDGTHFWRTIYARSIVGAEAITSGGAVESTYVKTQELRGSLTDLAIGTASNGGTVIIKEYDGAGEQNLHVYGAGQFASGISIDTGGKIVGPANLEIELGGSSYEIKSYFDKIDHHIDGFYSSSLDDFTGSLSWSNLDTGGSDLDDLQTSRIQDMTSRDHGELTGLTHDDHSIYVHKSIARTITAKHTFNPSVAGAPFIIGANADEVQVDGLKAEFASKLNRSVLSGDGLSGGGKLTTSRTLAVDSSVARSTWAVTAGAGLTGGGNLSSGGITVAVGAGTGITVNADDIEINQAAALTLTNLTVGSTGAPFAVAAGSQGQTVTGLKADTVNISVTGGAGLTGGGALTTDQALAVGAGDGVSVTTDAVAVDSTVARSTWLINTGDGLSGGAALSEAGPTLTVDSSVARNSWNVDTGAGLSGGGSLSSSGLTLTLDTSYSPTWTGAHTFQVTMTTRDLLPETADTYDIGSSLYPYSNLWASQVNAVIFAENTQQLIDHMFVIAHGSGILPEVVSTDTQIDFGDTMTVGDIIVIRGHDTNGNAKTEYMSIDSLSTGTTYNVTRDLAAAHATDPHWADGTVYQINGQTGDGRIELDNSDTPRISVITQGATYNAQTERARMGDLDGILSLASGTHGFAAAANLNAAQSSFTGFTVDPTNGMRLFNTDYLAYESGSLVTQIDETGLIFGDNTNSNNRKISWYDGEVGDVGSDEIAVIRGYTDGAARMDFQTNAPTGNDAKFYFYAYGTSSVDSASLEIKHDYSETSRNAIMMYADRIGLGHTGYPTRDGTAIFTDLDTSDYDIDGMYMGKVTTDNAFAMMFRPELGYGITMFSYQSGMYFSGELGLNATDPSYAFAHFDSSYDALIVDNIGIGTDSPDEMLHIYGTTPTIKLEDSAASLAYASISSDATDGRLQLSADDDGTNGSSHISFDVGGSTQMILDSNGLLYNMTDILIGPNTGNQQDHLTIYKGSPTITLEDWNNNYYSQISMDNGNLTIATDVGGGNASANTIIFEIDDDEVFRLNELNYMNYSRLDLAVEGRLVTESISSDYSEGISDDGVWVVTPPQNSGTAILYGAVGITNQARSDSFAIFTYKVTSTETCFIVLQPASEVEVTSGSALTGTTGTNGKITISAYNGDLYIENRQGVIAYEGILFLGF